MAKKKTPLACSRCGKQCRYPWNCCTKEKKEERDAAEFGRKFEAAAITANTERLRAFKAINEVLSGLNEEDRKRVIACHATLLGCKVVEF